MNEVFKFNDDITIKRALTGIYLLFDGIDVVYVGQSKNIYARVHGHMRNKEFTHWNCIECKVSELNDLEADLILSHKPKYNAKVHSNSKWISKSLAKKNYGISGIQFKKLIAEGYFSRVETFGDIYILTDEAEGVCNGKYMV